MIELEYNDKNVLNTISRFARTLQQGKPLMDVVSGTMQAAVEQNFTVGGRPRWLPLRSGRVGQILQDKGNLRSSIQRASGKDFAQVGTNIEYAPIHQFGGTIYPKNKKALAFKVGGQLIIRKSVTIPARPFLVLTTQDAQDILDDIQDYFKRLIG